MGRLLRVGLHLLLYLAEGSLFPLRPAWGLLAKAVARGQPLERLGRAQQTQLLEHGPERLG